MTDKTYNGWTNYETWLVNLWLDNEQGTSDYMREQAQECKDNPEPNEFVDGGFLSPAYTLGKVIKEYVEQMTTDDDQYGLTADLLNAALSHVNWREIADHYLDDL